MVRKLIGVGRLFHESNAYAPMTPGRSIKVCHNYALIENARGNGTTLGGIVDALAGRPDVEMVPIVDAMAAPSGMVEHEFYLEQRQLWEERLKDLKLDAVILDLHGAMATVECDDIEGDFLNHLREVVGNDVVIGVGLDLHANITPSMLAAADICIACKNNPHDDYYDTGKRVVELVFQMLDGRFHPVYAVAKARMIAPAKLETHEGPLKEMHAHARSLERATGPIADISLYNAFRFGDFTDMGQAAVLLSNGRYAEAERIVGEFAEGFWERRNEFKDDLLSIEEALEAVLSRQDPLPRAIADLGDRTLAGAPGDSTLILQAAMKHPGLRGALTVHDPETVERARSAGISVTLSMQLGGKLTPQYEPFTVDGVVKLVNDKDVKLKGPAFGGESAGMGDTALIEIDGRFQVIVTSKPGFISDPNIFESHGVTVGDVDFVVVKSQYHFNANFEGLTRSLYVASAGLAYYIPGVFKKTHARVWPDMDVSADPIIAPATIDRRAKLGAARSSSTTRSPA